MTEQPKKTLTVTSQINRDFSSTEAWAAAVRRLDLRIEERLADEGSKLAFHVARSATNRIEGAFVPEIGFGWLREPKD